MIGWLVEALLASAALIALVLAIRVPVRRHFGPGVAYALWALPLLRLLLPPLPAGWRAQAIAPLATPFSAPLSDVGQQMTMLIVPAAADGAVAPAGSATGMTLAILWSLGAAAFLAWQLVAYRRFRRRILADAEPIERIGGIEVIASGNASGPLAFGLAHRVVAFPRDFAGQYDANERALALAHELGHHARGDLAANWAALIVLALHWFNPLAWIAFRLFRSDQEMANDARVLAGRDAADRYAYASAIVKAARGGGLSAACHLRTIDHLKGRLRMMSSSTSRRRVIAGSATVGTLIVAALGATASGTAAAAQVRAKVEQATGVDFAAIEPAALFQAPPAPVPPVPPAAGETGHHRLVITTNGKTRVYENDAADAYVAAHPEMMPPPPPAPPAPPSPDVPPAPPAPPAPPVPPAVAARAAADAASYAAVAAGRAQVAAEAARVAAMRAVPQVSSRDCGPGDEVVQSSERNGHVVMTVCNDRIARMSENARRQALASIDVRAIRRQALGQARAGIAQARAAILANRNLSAADRREALAGLDEGMAEAEREIATEQD